MPPKDLPEERGAYETWRETVLDKIAANGLTPGPNGSAEDGKPKQPVEITSATVDSGNQD